MQLYGFSADAFGFIDLQAVIRQLKAIRPMTRDAARTVVQQSFRVVTDADKASGFAAQPGEVAKRSNIKVNLQRHSDVVGSGLSRYPNDEDLAKWAEQSFIAYNAAAASDQRLEDAKSEVFGDVWEAFQNVPLVIGNTVGTVVGGVGSAVGGLAGSALWAFLKTPLGLVLAGTAGVLVYGAYRASKSPAARSFARDVAVRRLGGR